MIRLYEVPGTHLAVAFLAGRERGRVEIRNLANQTVVDMSDEEWSELVERARYVRALAEPEG